MDAVALARTHPVVALNMFDHLLRRPALPGGFAAMLDQAVLAVCTRWTGPGVAPLQPPPLIPGGAWLKVTDRPHPDCLAWLIRTVAGRSAGLSGGQDREP
ncbi:hypothetical protein GCM10009828_022830 [Actinoplanes couchii]|uniref:Uncharacterized protein n=1 Tax=Actinoplanes couchii TaxID=403638 RepID=A0ABQ3XTQ9_9ACTN|nr:hypothetical protein Aco03nite_102520 [Actinoplanes couchii]